ncbi:EAL domain-containing protein [Hydrogenophaga sp. OTU3427]|uniref:EAL domain-containing protein n=1 Tax=Hydrogenophaga sp. OTU3427 TaxID=3043856 RepID=UPI00313C32AB
MPCRSALLRVATALSLALALCVAASAQAQARVVRVGVYHNPPKIMAGEGGQPSGILGDVLREMAQAEGWTLEPVACEWEACLAGLNNGRIDLMPDVARTDARLRLFDFHQVPALHSWSQLYRREGVIAESMLDLQGKRLAVLEGSSQQEYLQTLLAGFGLNTRFVTAPSFDAAFGLVAAGQADVVASNHHFGDLAAQRFKLHDTPLIFQPSRLFYATGKGLNPELLAAIDRRLGPWQADPASTYFQILKHWGAPLNGSRIPAVLWWSLGAVAAALLLALAFVALLKREVGRRTRELRASEDKLATILNSVDAYIYIKDTELRYLYANRQVCELFGQALPDVVGKGDSAFFDATTTLQLRAVDQQVLDSGDRLVEEETNRTHEGEVRTYLSVKMPLRNTEGHIYALCGISTDITDQRQFAQEIHQLAYYDPLTHLANRRQMIERLQQLLDDATTGHHQHALLLVNIDNFKHLNDLHGHRVGDLLLQQVAQRLNACARAGDLVARLGSDEFAILMSGLGTQPAVATRQVEQAATKLLQTVGEIPFELGSLSHRVSASIGVAMLNQPQTTVDAVLKHADMALAQAKSGGRNGVRFFRSDMEVVAAARAALEADLRDGMAKGQFLLHYQPQVDERGQMFGVEALVRWQHPTRGLVPPGSFIGLAEVSGLIEPLGLWILRTACQQLHVWSSVSGREHLCVAVNISARQLHHPDFVRQVTDILQETGARPDRLELELTESQLVEDMSGATAKMQALKALGVRLSLDDFGTGYSSLNYLKRLPLHQLKIDQSFVRDLLLDANDLSIVKAVVDMGRNLNLSVLAEGVETTAQRDMLLQAGCHLFQGYLFGRPVPVEQLPAP